MDLQDGAPDCAPSCKIKKYPSDQNHNPQITSLLSLTGISVQVSTDPNPSIQSGIRMAKCSCKPIFSLGTGFYGERAAVIMIIQLRIFVQRYFPANPCNIRHGLFLHPTDQHPSSPEGMAFDLKPDVRRIPHKPQTPVHWARRAKLSENGC